jgi:membrane associated rhomboid family serine protease
MPLIPIGTDVRPRSLPVGNWLLIGLNVLIYLATSLIPEPERERLLAGLTLNAYLPQLGEYVTYQFLHGDFAHLGGNMLFLWIFGNPVCDRMGSLSYLLFYLAGGVFAGTVFAIWNDNPMLGASGAIAAVTTAFLVLYPRVHITMLLWLFIVTTIQVPAMVLIVIKVILWDNIIAPRLPSPDGMRDSVAYSAHLGGYFFGLVVPLVLLSVHALPRNQFDLLALWSRWRRRSGLTIDMGSPPRMARPVRAEELSSRPIEALTPSPTERVREDVLLRMSERDLPEAARLWRLLVDADPRQVLPRSQQLILANHLAETRRHTEAARAYEAFLAAYPSAPDVPQVRLMLGLLYTRYLDDPRRAASHLTIAADALTLEPQRALAQSVLGEALAHMSRGASAVHEPPPP